LLNEKVTRLSLIKFFIGKSTSNGLPIISSSATYTIKATNLAGDSTATVSISVSLGIPRNLVATKGDAVINLTWNPVSGATGYKIYYSQNEINASNLGSTPSVQVSNASGRVSGLTNN
jgi:hypothetical protein